MRNAIFIPLIVGDGVCFFERLFLETLAHSAEAQLLGCRYRIVPRIVSEGLDRFGLLGLSVVRALWV